MTRPRYSKYAVGFLLGGIIMTGGLFFLMTAKSPFAGWGDGAGHFDAPPAGRLILPYSAYFICGIIATRSDKREVRIVACLVAHLAPMITFAFAGRDDALPFVIIDFVTFMAFGFVWFQMLRKDN